MSTPIFEVDNLRAHYLTRFGQKIQAVDGVSFSLQPGEILGIAGESGCGKTTLVSACMGLYIPPLHLSSGDVRIEGKSIIGMNVETNRREILGRKISMIPQGALNSLNPTRKVKDLATDMILSHDESADKKEIHARLRGRFQKLGLPADEVLNSYPVQLPAGMKQRVVIGISTLLDPRVVI
ncbi:MAG TPA: ATP-binding cassette domain-containing protein, partial [Polyangiaceae bacterium]